MTPFPIFSNVSETSSVHLEERKAYALRIKEKGFPWVSNFQFFTFSLKFLLGNLFIYLSHIFLGFIAFVSSTSKRLGSSREKGLGKHWKIIFLRYTLWRRGAKQTLNINCMSFHIIRSLSAVFKKLTYFLIIHFNDKFYSFCICRCIFLRQLLNW